MELEGVKKRNFVIHDIEKRNVCCMKCVMCIIEKRMSNPACLFYHDENILKDYLKKINLFVGASTSNVRKYSWASSSFVRKVFFGLLDHMSEIIWILVLGQKIKCSAYPGCYCSVSPSQL